MKSLPLNQLKQVRLVFAFLVAIITVLIAGCQKETGDALNSKVNELQPASSNVNELGQIILGAPTGNSIKMNLLFDKSSFCRIDYSRDSISFSQSTAEMSLVPGMPTVVALDHLEQGSRYYYRLRYRENNSSQEIVSPVYSFVTQRQPGSTFSFGIQGDSHPERPDKMFNTDLYKINMRNVAAKGVDLYFTIGDDFSIERLIQFNNVSQATVDQVYSSHRQYLGIAGSNASIFLVNGNHEQAALCNLNGSAINPAVCAGNARKKFYPVPLPDNFYSGDLTQVDHVGQLGDYYAFTWGDALFVVIDFYWHTSTFVDNGGTAPKNLWDNTLGVDQYNWFKSTLENSKAKYKFVFAHHVLGTGRGGVELADLCEWGGNSTNGNREFEKYRPGWTKPIHQLMADNKVTIFFQGHDHLFCRQELDGVVYQSLPNPADNTYTAFNADAYKTGTAFPNSGFVNVSVSPQKVQVDYISACLPGDETALNKNGMVKYSYSIIK
jgi:hypothetical protein